MSLIVPNTAEVLMLKYILNNLTTDGTSPTANGNRVLRLFTNNVVPTNTTTLAGLTEATEAGYAAITLTGASWAVATSGGITTASYAKQTFYFTTSVSVFGYYVTTAGGSPELLWAERFPSAPFSFLSSGGEIDITPKVSLD